MCQITWPGRKSTAGTGGPSSLTRWRQNWPPARGFESTSVTRAPARRAAVAAARPAGPAPRTAMSRVMAGALLRSDVIAGLDLDLAGPLVGAAVDDHQAVEAHADAAEHAAWFAGVPGGPPRPVAGRDQRRADALAGLGGDLGAVEGERHHANRSGRNGVRSSSGSSPVSVRAMR